jgi:hypothetical protein
MVPVFISFCYYTTGKKGRVYVSLNYPAAVAQDVPSLM